jgi:hypothetical protein
MLNAAQNGKIAQLILSLATTPDRAATTVGDMLEESAARGSLWFWSNILRTASSLWWRDFRSAAHAPARAMGSLSPFALYIGSFSCL